MRPADMTTETTRGSEQAEATPARLPDHLLEMLRRPSLCFVSTLAEDGTPHATRAWGRHRRQAHPGQQP